MNKVFRGTVAALLAVASVAFVAGCAKKGAGNAASARKGATIAVFVPGVVSGSPVYEMLVAGTQKAVAEFPSAKVQVIEAGTNQAEWGDKLVSLVADA